MPNTKDFSGKFVVITGASKGIGKAAAVELAARGASLILTYNSDAKGAKETAEIVKKSGGQCFLIKADLSKDADRIKISKEVFKITKKLDVLINNAGFYDVRDGPNAPAEALDKYFAVHATSVVRLCSLLKPLMHPKTSIINISSKNATLGRPVTLGYSASKAAMNSITKTLAQVYAPIRVNSISPGPVMTPMWNGDNEETLKSVARGTILNRFGEPEEVAKVIAFVASDDASFMTGSDVVVDGGALIKNNY